MRKRAALVWACLVYTGLGLAIGLADLHRLIQFPVQRLENLVKEPPTPRTVFWAEGLQRPLHLLDAWERPLGALTLLLFIGVCVCLGFLLNPRFRLLKPPDEHTGRGATAHLDVPRALRAGAALLLTGWLLGFMGPLGLVLSRGTGTLFLLLGGLPAWTAGFPPVPAAFLQALILGGVIWWVWGPRGWVAPNPAVSGRDAAFWALVAGLAAFPAILALNAGRVWLQAMSTAFSMADRSGWTGLILGALLIPALSGLYLAFHNALCRPRTTTPALRAGALVGAGAALVAGGVLALVGQSAAAGVDVGAGSLARLLKLEPSPLSRLAVLVAPSGRSVFSVAEDGSTFDPAAVDLPGVPDRIACNGDTVKAVEEFLVRRRYRSHLVYRAYIHLNACASLDWLTTRSLQVSLEMLEKAPSPLVARTLREKISDAAITPENRAILDQLADARRFAWPEPDRSRWLGLAYRRFGDAQKAQQYLLHAQLSEAEIGMALRGLTPLSEGVVRGKLTLRGKPVPLLRVGLVSLENWRQMVGPSLAYGWRHVLAAAHTDDQGRYEFKNIPEGDYVLIITGGGIGRFGGRPEVSPSPGIIRLNRFQPTFQVPTFDLEFIRPIRAPEGEGSRTTV